MSNPEAGKVHQFVFRTSPEQAQAILKVVSTNPQVNYQSEAIRYLVDLGLRSLAQS